MASIREIKQELRHREWAEQIQECQNSGITVKEWYESSGIRLSTYYSRLKEVREETLSRRSELRSIVPVSVSTEMSDSGTPLLAADVSSDAQNHLDGIVIRKNDLKIEMPCNASEQIINAMLRALKKC